MTVRLDGAVIRLEGACRVEEAEALTALLQAGVRPIDMSACRLAHSAVLQVLLAFRPPVAAEPAPPSLLAVVRALGLGSPEPSGG